MGTPETVPLASKGNTLPAVPADMSSYVIDQNYHIASFKGRWK